MIKNYFTIAYRNITRHRLASFVSIFGLTVGITFFLLLFAYVWDELNYDRFHEKSDVTHILSARIKQSEPNFRLDPNVGLACKEKFPEISNFTQIFALKMALKSGMQNNQEVVAFARPSYLELFSFPIKNGVSVNPLNQMNNAVISEKIAEKYFGNSDPVGKSVRLSIFDIENEFIIKGVLKDIPGNSSLSHGIIIPMQNAITYGVEDFPVVTFFEMKKNVSIKEFEKKLSSTTIEFSSAMTFHRKVDPASIKYSIQKFTDYHLSGSSILGVGLKPAGEMLYVYIYSALALGVLLLACFNYINLSIGNLSSRFKEIGARKVIGAERKEIISQFLIEAGCITCVAFFISLLLTQILMPAFNQLANKTLLLKSLISVSSIAVVLLILIVTTLFTGSYPALILSRISSADILRGRTILGENRRLSRFFIVMQFCIAILLISGTLLINKQMNFIRTRDLGFDPKNVVVIDNVDVDSNVGQAFKESLLNNPMIESVSCDYNGGVAGMTNGNSEPRMPMSLIKDGKEIKLIEYVGDYDYIKTLRLNLIQGRSLSSEYPSDFANAIVVNESFVKAFNLKDPVGKNIADFAEFKNIRINTKPNLIVGVVKDFHGASLHKKITPGFIWHIDYALTSIIVRLRANNTQAALNLLRQNWNNVSQNPFSYRFLEDDLNAQYKNEDQWNDIFNFTSFVAILIACMGLLGFSSIVFTRRTKEIGIRKVLGAELKSIIYMLTKEFVILICIACIITCPFIIYLGNNWLESFAYKASIGADTILFALLISLSIALATVSYNTIKAAFANPIDSIKCE